jgi:ABC-2 type transport system ATP-binding protein
MWSSVMTDTAPTWTDRGDTLRVEELTVRYGSLVACDRLSFGVARGRICGLVGRNGAGKSTCIRVLAGLLEPASGDATILGRPLAELAAVRGDVGYLIDDPALFAYLGAEETLRFLAAAYSLPAAEAAARTEDLLRFFDFDRNRGQLVDEYSTGMTKRLSIAAALVHAPRVLILDEPFESLDPLIVRRLKRLLLRFARSGGTALVSTHLVGVVEEICDDVVIVERGRVVAAGGLAEVVAAAPAGEPTLEAAYAAAVDEGPGDELVWMTPKGSAKVRQDPAAAPVRG